MTIYVDMDGVLADFDSHYAATFGEPASKLTDNVDWKKVREHPDFYLHIPPMPDMRELWAYVSRHSPTILTGTPASVADAEGNKRRWVARHISKHVPVICCRSREKYQHCKPGDILIDDWIKYRDLWQRAGGLFFLHVSAQITIRQLHGRGI